MKVTVKNFNLLRLKNVKIWHQLVTLTKITGVARDHFAHIQYNVINNTKNSYWYDIAKIRCVIIAGEIVAWGVVIKQQDWECRQIWLFTDPQYRNQGLQKKYIMPYFRLRYPNCKVQTWYSPQKETFKYYQK
jgi:hypothetical protein